MQARMLTHASTLDLLQCHVWDAVLTVSCVLCLKARHTVMRMPLMRDTRWPWSEQLQYMQCLSPACFCISCCKLAPGNLQVYWAQRTGKYVVTPEW